MFNGFGDYSPFSGNTEFRVFQEPAPARSSAPARQRPRTKTHVEVEAPVAPVALAPEAPAPAPVSAPDAPKPKQVKVASAPVAPFAEPEKPKAPKAPRLKVVSDALKPTASESTSRKSTVMSVLWKQAQQRGDIKGYNRMSRAQLETALGLNSSQS